MLRARVVGGRLVLEVEDDGRGLPEGEAAPEGIGLSNIRERLEQLYPGSHEFTLCRRPEGGATARIVIPYLIASPEPAARAD
jgi:signal transduction histidine kinase